MSEERTIDARKMQSFKDFEHTGQIIIPTDPMERVIGQDDAVELAKIAARQMRHLLLIGPPGTGKSMIAQAIALYLRKPKEEIQIVHNPEQPERPSVEVKTLEEVIRERKERETAEGELIEPTEAPIKVAEQLGFRCINCGTYSSHKEGICPRCERPKVPPMKGVPSNPFSDIIGGIVEVTVSQLGAGVGKSRVTTTRRRGSKEEVVVYERSGEMIKVLDQKALERRRALEKQSPRKVLVPLDRNPFVMATGASETELLGDVRHDPYGGHPQLGSLPYERVIPGAIHEAHEGVLFIDELPHLGNLQRYILTAMQEKKFSISGRNPQSAGASVRVDNVPCDFIFVGACNIQDLPHIISPLRSRIIGNGYDALLDTTIPDTEENRIKMVQFVAQEVHLDGKIPEATIGAVEAIIEVSRKRAKVLDGKDNALTLRLRDMGGLIRTAGDIAMMNGAKYIERVHVEFASKRCMSAEEQIKERYGSYYAGLARDITTAQKEITPYNYWNYHIHDDKTGYE